MRLKRGYGNLKKVLNTNIIPFLPLRSHMKQNSKIYSTLQFSVRYNNVGRRLKIIHKNYDVQIDCLIELESLLLKQGHINLKAVR